jgi:TRAP-type C4-dicarboxylate transport system substrate-binding protein
MKTGKISIVLFIFTALLTFIALPTSNSAAADVIEIKANGFHPMGHRLYPDAFDVYSNQIEKRTNGKVKFKWFPAHTLVPQFKTYDGLKSGIIDWAYIINAFNPNEFVLTNSINLPFAAINSSHAAAILWEMSEDFPGLKAEYKKMVPLFWYSTAPVHIHTNSKKHRPKTLEDLKGLRIGCPGPILVKYMNALGIAGQQVEPGDLYTALQRGMIDGVMFPEAPLRSQKLTDLVDYHLMMSFGVDVFTAGMNLNSWKKLPPDVQQVFLDISESAGALCGATITNESAWVMEELKKRGDVIYYLPDSEKAKMKQVLQPFFDDWIQKIGQRGLDGKEILVRIDQIAKDSWEYPYQPDPWWGRAGKKE